jgi:hypothetical protein
MSPELAIGLIVVGFAVGTYASATGAGGGFLIGPLLLIRYPDADPAAITAASLSVVLLSSGAQSLLIARERRVDHRAGLGMASLTIPAALLGAYAATVLPRSAFAFIFALLLFAIGAYVIARPVAAIATPTRRRAWRRELVDRDGNHYVYRIPLLASIAPNVGSGFLAALTGIGGGPIGVPVLTRVMRVPHAIAVPTMHLVIVLQTVCVLALHVALGSPGDPMRDVPWLGVGVILASPAGSWVRRRLGEGALMRALGVGIFFVAARTALDILL